MARYGFGDRSNPYPSPGLVVTDEEIELNGSVFTTSDGRIPRGIVISRVHLHRESKQNGLVHASIGHVLLPSLDEADAVKLLPKEKCSPSHGKRSIMTKVYSMNLSILMS